MYLYNLFNISSTLISNHVLHSNGTSAVCGSSVLLDHRKTQPGSEIIWPHCLNWPIAILESVMWKSNSLMWLANSNYVSERFLTLDLTVFNQDCLFQVPINIFTNGHFKIDLLHFLYRSPLGRSFSPPHSLKHPIPSKMTRIKWSFLFNSFEISWKIHSISCITSYNRFSRSVNERFKFLLKIILIVIFCY